MMDEALEARATALRETGEAFAIATVVRTVNATAAKPGAKALVRADGAIELGWIGGGCVRRAIGAAACAAVGDGRPRLISLRPEDLLDAEGVAPGEEREGSVYARNGCPSEGSMDVFVEPVLPQPVLAVLGDSPVAEALASLAATFDYRIARGAAAERVLEARGNAALYCVVATQGAGDLDALRTAAAAPTAYCAFVGSRKKFEALGDRLRAGGADAASLQRVSAPAGLNIAAITPQEIALSILAEITQRRRDAQRERQTKDAACA